jgi:hypothetical protein
MPVHHPLCLPLCLPATLFAAHLDLLSFCLPRCQVDYPERVGMLHRLLTPLSPRW